MDYIKSTLSQLYVFFLVMSLFTLGTPVIIKITSTCSRYNCQFNCSASISTDNKELLPRQKGAMFHIVVMENHNGRTKTLSLDMRDDSQKLLDKTKGFLSDIPKGYLLILMAQGCYELPTDLQNILYKYSRGIDRFRHGSYQNLFVSCVDRCPLKKPIIYTRNYLTMRRNISIKFKGHLEQILSTTYATSSNITTPVPKSVVPTIDPLVKLIAFICVGVLLFFAVTVLIYLCFTKTSPNKDTTNCWGRPQKVPANMRGKLVRMNTINLGYNDYNNSLYDVISGDRES